MNTSLLRWMRFLVGVLALAFGGCTRVFNVAGHFDDYSEVFKGTGVAGVAGSHFEFRGERTGLVGRGGGIAYYDTIVCDDGRSASYLLLPYGDGLFRAQGVLSDGTRFTLYYGNAPGSLDGLLGSFRRAADARLVRRGGSEGDEGAVTGGGVPPRAARIGPVSNATGIYLLEQDLTFNVLDRAAFDPETGRVSLFGHRDYKYEGGHIPYLQHLAELLDNAAPEFSLEWTNSSERQVDAFLRRLDDERYMASLVSRWAEPLDSKGRVKQSGRWILKAWGVDATKNGKAAGYLGLHFTYDSSNPESPCKVTRVDPGSPADRAGIRVGDRLAHINNQNAYHPKEATRLIRQAGAGATIEVWVNRPGGKFERPKVTLGASREDPWKYMDRYEITGSILIASGRREVGNAIRCLGQVMRLADIPPARTKALELFVLNSGGRDAYNRMWKDVQSGRKTKQQALDTFHAEWLAAMESTFSLRKGTLVNVFNRNRHQGAGDAFDAAFTSLNDILPGMLDSALREMTQKQDEVLIPSEVIVSALGFRPEVVPKYYNVAGKSRLARVLFQADILGKRLVNMPELAGEIPGYKTDFTFYRENPRANPVSRSATSERMWISIESIDLRMSEEGTTLEIGDAKMRFNIAKMAGGKQGEYEKLLTRLYEPFARRFPVLHELREASKLAAVAKWILAHDPKFRLPKEGRATWNGPASAPGLIFMYWAPKYKANVANVSVMAMGGISLAPVERKRPIPSNPNVVELRGRSTVVPRAFDNQVLAKMLKPKTVPPSPIRWKGSVVRTEKGAESLRGIDQVITVLGKRAKEFTKEDLDLLRSLKEARHRALQLAHTERIVNHITGKNPLRQEELEGLGKELKDARREFIKESIDIITSGILDSEQLLGQAGTIPADVKGAVDDIKKKADMLRKFRSDDPAEREELMSELTDMAGDLLQKLEGEMTGPLSKALKPLVKSIGYADKLKSACDTGKSLIVLTKAHFRINELGDQIEKDNKILKTVLPLYEKQRLELSRVLKRPNLVKALGEQDE